MQALFHIKEENRPKHLQLTVFSLGRHKKYTLSPSESEGEPGVFHCPFSAVMLHTGKFPP